MTCPYCGYNDSKVIDSRPTDEGKTIRRRRECLDCQERFTTYEKIENVPISVVKRNGTRQLFDIDKLTAGLMRASVNRPISREDIDEIALKIEDDVTSLYVKEISTNQIAEITLKYLKDLDEVAYIRFASVANRFTDIDSFLSFLKEMKESK